MQTNFLEWVKKAESDWSAVKILAVSKHPPNDVIMFHCQQTAEKYLKAHLSKNLGSLEKTHNLLKLSSEAEKSEPSVNILSHDLTLLNDFSISPRYPGDYSEPTRQDVDKAIASTKRIRFFFRKILGVKRKKK